MMLFSRSCSLLFAAVSLLVFCWSAKAEEAVLSLAGEWKFQLDPKDTGTNEKWFTRKLEDRVMLPGTTDENQKGVFQDEKPIDRLARPWYWKGPVWYQREVIVPESWSGKRITVFFERTKNSRVWVDGTFCGRDDSLSAPHIFDVTQVMTPGIHTITVLVDNAKLPPVGPAHAVDERTQTNWNGIVGRMELRATDTVWIEEVRVYPEIAKKQARVRMKIVNITGKPATGKVKLACRSYNIVSPATFAVQSVDVIASQRENVIEVVYQPGEGVPLWDEFSPALLELDLKLEAEAGGQSSSHQTQARFGMREFTREGHLLKNNGKTVFLRGRIDSANFPLTGYAPMEKATWRKLLEIHKAWGLNHIRYHSWCPPAAAFEAADELGIYLHAELPNKRSAFNAPDNKEAAIHNIDWLDQVGDGTGVSLYDYGKREGELIMRHFGNHPSFTLFTLGNELGRTQGMFDLVTHFKKTDPRHLVAQGSNNMHWQPSLAEGDDFWVTGKVEQDGRPLRGSFALADFPNPHIETAPPSTLIDFSKSIEGISVPLIGHETGQFQVAPDYRDIPKFTGVLKARNYEIFRERITVAGMLDQAQEFVRASGALSAICYREDIEAALRTPEFGGFQLLDIMDFPGQGTALVGMLNVFMESKGIIEPEKWREFCCETVPLFRMEKYTWTADEILKGRVQVAHYGVDTLRDVSIIATLTDGMGKQLASYTFPPAILESGGLREVGEYQLSLNSLGISGPQKLTLTFQIGNTHFLNHYPIWVYPHKVDTLPPERVMIANRYTSDATQAHLAAGGKVLLLPTLDRLPQSVPGGFQCEFWSPMFAESAKKRGGPQPAGTLGILCDPTSPALAAFPTEFHSNWQWWHLVKNSRPIAFEGTPVSFRPTVQVIDNFVRNQKLGIIAETKVGQGAMLICAIDLQAHQDKPEARQLLHSLLRYMDSSAFAPEIELEAALLHRLLP